MKPIAVLRHGPDIPLGHLGDVLDAASIAAIEVPLYSGATLPDLDSVSAVVVLGGQMGAYDEAIFPYLRDEKELIREAARRQMPVLGVCLGGQLAADALGGKAFLAPEPEVEVLDVTLTEAGRDDPVARYLDGPVLVWHQDTWEMPPGATELARSSKYPMAFRHGTVLGIQPHPEASPEIAKGWVDSHPDWLASRGFDAEALLDVAEQNRQESRLVAEGFFGAWLANL
ncbi:MAG: type 1 glutamine amidotransferase [Acidimicrobiia bacterium]|nr:type 1 glutamine amidotransferase [Acidimicrobiia bacterium]